MLRGNSVVTERGVTLDELLVDAEELAADGVDGADEMVELIAAAIHAEPGPTDRLTDPPIECHDAGASHRATLGWRNTRMG